MRKVNKWRSFRFILFLNLILLGKVRSYLISKCHPTSPRLPKRLLTICHEVDPKQEVLLIDGTENTPASEAALLSASKKSSKSKKSRSTTKSSKSATSKARTTRAKGSASATEKPGKTKKPAATKKSTKSSKAKKSKADAKEAKSSTKKSTAAKKSSKAKKPKGPTHWIEESDEVLLQHHDGDDGRVSGIRFKVRGNPRPLQRHRSSYGFQYNPSAKLQESFRQVVQELVFFDNNIQAPLFEADAKLVMTILFRQKRPKKDFIGGKPGPERMRENAPPQTSQTRTDVDNLIKFVLDSLNEVLYQDDRQILSVHVTKILDNEGMCEGSTEIYLRSIEDEDIDNLINNSFQILK